MKEGLGQSAAESFRDPSGYVFTRHGIITRLIRETYRENYDLLISSGLYRELTAQRLMVAHREVAPTDDDRQQHGNIYKLLKPELIPMISYPYEWSFSQLKNAALLVLDIEKRALLHGMTLKDAPAQNVQFMGCRPVFIDTLSFESYKPGSTWKAYRQFCSHFLAPLLLMAKDYRLKELLLHEIDGIDLGLASRLLPWHSHFSLGKQLHIHLHARALNSYKDGMPDKYKSGKMSWNGRLGMLDNLEAMTRKIKWPHPVTEWQNYYQNTNYSTAALNSKEAIVVSLLRKLPSGGMAWDFGANDGRFSQAAVVCGFYTVAIDIDPVAVENNYRTNEGNEHILPLNVDLRNPSPANGWAGKERRSLTQRGPADVGMALALIHHLAISNNVPLPQLADWFAAQCKNLVIEFVPKSDSMVQRLLSSREDIFPNYDAAHFVAAFAEYFDMVEEHPIPDSERTIYLMKRKAS